MPINLISLIRLDAKKLKIIVDLICKLDYNINMQYEMLQNKIDDQIIYVPNDDSCESLILVQTDDEVAYLFIGTDVDGIKLNFEPNEDVIYDAHDKLIEYGIISYEYDAYGVILDVPLYFDANMQSQLDLFIKEYQA